MAMRLFAEDREILAKALPIHGGVGNLMHPIICSAHGNAPLYSKTSEILVTAARRWNALSSTRWQISAALPPNFYLRDSADFILRLRRLLSPSSSEKPIRLCRHAPLPLFQFFVHFGKGVHREFQIFARMRCRHLCADPRCAMRLRHRLFLPGRSAWHSAGPHTGVGSAFARRFGIRGERLCRSERRIEIAVNGHCY